MGNHYIDLPTGVVVSGVESLNGLDGALVLTGGAGVTITPSGSNIEIDVAMAASADQQLSNLSGTTAIPVDLLPFDNSGSPFTFANLGSQAKPFGQSSWITVINETATYYYDESSSSAPYGQFTGSIEGNVGAMSSYSPSLSVYGNADLLISASGPVNNSLGNATGLGMIGFKTTGASSNTQRMLLASGDATGTTSNSGDVVLYTGTATGTRGSIKLTGPIVEIGSLKVPIRFSAVNATLSAVTDQILIIEDTNVLHLSNTVTLPAGIAGLQFTVKATQANQAVWSFVTTGGDTIDGTVDPGGGAPVTVAFLNGVWYNV